MIAGSLLSAFTVGLAITLTLPWLANAFSSPVKSLMWSPTVNVPPVVGMTRCVNDTASPACSISRFQFSPPQNCSLSVTSITFA